MQKCFLNFNLKPNDKLATEFKLPQGDQNLSGFLRKFGSKSVFTQNNIVRIGEVLNILHMFPSTFRLKIERVSA